MGSPVADSKTPAFVAFIFIVLNFRVMLMGRREFAAAFNEN